MARLILSMATIAFALCVGSSALAEDRVFVIHAPGQPNEKCLKVPRVFLEVHMSHGDERARQCMAEAGACGLGIELTLLLPPLMALYGRRRKSA